MIIKFLKFIHQEFLRSWPEFVATLVGASCGIISANNGYSTFEDMGFFIIGGLITIALIAFLRWIRPDKNKEA